MIATIWWPIALTVCCFLVGFLSGFLQPQLILPWILHLLHCARGCVTLINSMAVLCNSGWSVSLSLGQIDCSLRSGIAWREGLGASALQITVYAVVWILSLVFFRLGRHELKLWIHRVEDMIHMAGSGTTSDCLFLLERPLSKFKLTKYANLSYKES